MTVTTPKTWEEVEDLIARAIYEKWPTTFERTVFTTEADTATRREIITDSWEETCAEDPGRAKECRDAARRIARALRAAGILMIAADGAAVAKAQTEQDANRFGGFRYPTRDGGHEDVIRDHHEEARLRRTVVLWRRPTDALSHDLMMAELDRLRMAAALSAGEIAPPDKGEKKL